MAIPSLPAQGSTEWYSHYQSLDETVRGLEAKPAGETPVGGVRLESFIGATDDDKLTAAMNYVAAQTYKPAILLSENRLYSFATKRDLFSGLKIIGSQAFSNQYRGALSTPQRVDLNIAGGGAWLNMISSSVFDVEIKNLSFYSQSSTTDFMSGHATGVLWTSVIRDCGWSLFRHVFGSPTVKLLLTACDWGGWWNINNSRGTSLHLGGSDNVLWVGNQFLLDSPSANSGTTPYHMWLDYMEKTTVGHLFCTGEGNPASVRVSGNDSSGGLVFLGGRYEGRNQNQPSKGSVIRQEGGRVTYRDIWTAYGYADPAGSVRTGEGGVVSVLGGTALFDGCWYSRAGASGVGETVPWIYASGANTKVTVRNAEVTFDGGTWAGLPRVQAANGATVISDESVTVI